MWRFFSFHTYPATKPSVMEISVKVPSHVEQLLSNGNYAIWPFILRDRKSLHLIHIRNSSPIFHIVELYRPARFRNTDILSGNCVTENTDLFNTENFCIDITSKFRFLMYERKHLYLFSRDPRKPRSFVRMNWFFPNELVLSTFI